MISGDRPHAGKALKGQGGAWQRALTRRSVELGGTNKILENINKETRGQGDAAQVASRRSSTSWRRSSSSSRQEPKKLEEESAEGAASVESTKKELDGQG